MLVKSQSDSSVEKKAKRSSESRSVKHALSAISTKKLSKDDADIEVANTPRSFVENEVYETGLDVTKISKKQSKQIWEACAAYEDVQYRFTGELANNSFNTEIEVNKILDNLSNNKKLQKKVAEKFASRQKIFLNELLKFIPEIVETKNCHDILAFVMPSNSMGKSPFVKNMLIDIFREEQFINSINQFFKIPMRSQKGTFSLWPFIYREIYPKAATGIAAAVSKGVGDGDFADYLLPLVFVTSSLIGLYSKEKAKKYEKRVSQFKEKYSFLGQLLNLCYIVGMIENKSGEFAPKQELKDIDAICAKVWARVLDRFGLKSFKYFNPSQLIKYQLTMKIALVKYILRWREEEIRLRNEGQDFGSEFSYDAGISSIIIDKFEDLIAPTILYQGFIKNIFKFEYPHKHLITKELATSAFDKAILEAQAIIIRAEARKEQMSTQDAEEGSLNEGILGPLDSHISKSEAQKKVLADSIIYEKLISNFGVFKTEQLQTIYRVSEDGAIIQDAKDKILSDVMKNIAIKLAAMEGTKSKYKAPFWLSVLSGYLKGEAFAQVNKNLRKLSFLSPIFAFIGSAVYIFNNAIKKVTAILSEEYNKFTREYGNYKVFLKFLHTNNMLNVTYKVDSKGVSSVNDVKLTKSYKLTTRILALTWRELAEDKINPVQWINKNYTAKDQAFISLRILNGMSYLIQESVINSKKLRMPDQYLTLIAKRFAEEIRSISSVRWKDRVLKFTFKKAITAGLHAKDIPVWIQDEIAKKNMTLANFYVPLKKIDSDSPNLQTGVNPKVLEFIDKIKSKKIRPAITDPQVHDLQAILDPSERLLKLEELEKTTKVTPEQSEEIRNGVEKQVRDKKLANAILSRGRSFIAYGQIMPVSEVSRASTIIPSIGNIGKSTSSDEISVRQNPTKKDLFADIFMRGKDVSGVKKAQKDTDSERYKEGDILPK